MPRTAEEVLSRFNRLKSERGNWESLWRDSADYVLTRKNNIATTMTGGTNRDVQVFDTTACRANEKFAAGMFSYLCPPGEEWFKVRSPHKQLMEYDEVRTYFDEVSRCIREALYLSNFVLEMHEAFLDDGAFGTANVYIAEGKQTPLVFRTIHIDEYCIAENQDGKVDTVYRKFEMTLRQAAQMFGLKKLHENHRRMLEKNASQSMEKMVKVVHAVLPREDAELCKMDVCNMPFASIYADVENVHILHEGGYMEQPYMVFRFTKASNEVWGRGPGTTLIPEIKLLNKIKKTCLIGGEKAVDPPIFVPDDGVIGQLRTTPSAVNYWRANAFGNKPEYWEFKGQLPVGIEMMNMEKMEIERGFYLDLFEQLAQRKQEMTATEVVERVREKLVLIAPAIGRTQNEFLSPMISRAYRLLGDIGVLPTAPPVLRSYPAYEIYYVSKLAMAIKLLDIEATQETFQTVMPLAQIDPTVMDSFNLDAIVRGTAHRNGVPAEFVNSREDVAAIREERRKKMEMAEAMKVAETMGKASQGLGKPVEPGSPLASLAGTMAPNKAE